jgi:indolepyruvate ferredoxin oxidoreductase alpha subunit
MPDRLLLSGNEAVALGAFHAGCTFGSGYPGTPSSEILPALLALRAREGGNVYCEWSINEKVALEAAAGACLTRARCLVTMKHVGLNVAADPFFTLAYTGVEGGVVIISADDPGLHSSQNEQDNRFYARHAGVPMLEPADSQEAYEFTKLAFALSEEFDTPVLLRMTTRVSHSRSPVVATGDRVEPNLLPAPKNQSKYVMVPAYAAQRHAIMLDRLTRLTAWAEAASINRAEPGGGDVAFVSAGVAYEYLREVMPSAPVLKLGMTYPLPPALARGIAGGRRLIAVEELEPYLAEQLAALGITAASLPADLRLGELTPARVCEALDRLGVTVEHPVAAPMESPEASPALPSRPPVLCPGCSHRPVFHVLKRMGLLVTGDIGCYTLGALPPLAALHTCLCMGAGISEAHGISRALDGAQPVVAVIGDSTFAHSGLPALANMVYNRSNAVVLILDNRTTAMTGGQDHPGTGRTLMGEDTPAMDPLAVAQAMGVGFARRVNAYDIKTLRATIGEALAHDGPAVIVTEGPCALLYRVRSDPYAIDEQTCVACGLCLQLGCPAIQAEEREGMLCTGCGLCAEVCPTNAIHLLPSS